DEQYFHALATELNREYRAIIAAGILLQVDDPFLPDIFVEPGFDEKQKKRRAEIYVEATNEALSGIAAERVRFHPCYGLNEGRRIHESNLPEIIEYVLKINAGSFSFEAANPRHEHEYHLFERVKLPEEKVLCPGVITHASNIVEHPEWIAERLIRFAKLVGRENVMAGADCGFSSQAGRVPIWRQNGFGIDRPTPQARVMQSGLQSGDQDDDQSTCHSLGCRRFCGSRPAQSRTHSALSGALNHTDCSIRARWID